jgi:hypothetical protein
MLVTIKSLHQCPKGQQRLLQQSPTPAAHQLDEAPRLERTGLLTEAVGTIAFEVVATLAPALIWAVRLGHTHPACTHTMVVVVPSTATINAKTVLVRMDVYSL